MERRAKIALALSLGALVWCITVGLALWFLPLGSSVSGSSSASMPGTSNDIALVSGSESFASISALGALPLLVPTLLSAAAVWAAFRRHRLILVAATAVLALFVLLAILSIGAAYMPALLALAAALAAAPGDRGLERAHVADLRGDPKPYGEGEV